MKITQSLLSWRSSHRKNIQSPLRSLAWAFLPSAAAILTLLLSTASSSYAATALHHYTFDGPGVIDSVGTANGTLFNGASVSSGRLNLDGIDDYVQFDEHIIPTVGDFSVAFFAQEISPQTTYTEIISQGFSGGPGFYIGYDPSHDFRIGDDLLYTGLPFPSDGFLHHYAVTAGSDTRLYVDGSLVATFGPIGMTTDGDDTRLGRQYDPFAEFFDGNLDELWVYSGTLTAEEVASLAAFNSAMWNLNPGSGDWNTATNWTPATVPNSGASTATFASSNITSISLSASTDVNGIVFNAGASAFTITASPTFILTISGVGITNNSAITQNFVTAVDGAGNFGTIAFTNSATAGSLTAFTINGAAVGGAYGGAMQFFGTSTAGNATLIANSGLGAGGLISFGFDCTGGTARVEVFGNGNLDISLHNAPGVTTGSIEGTGAVFLGAFNLTVGSNNLSTAFSGVIQDGGLNGGTGGSLTKIGKGKLTLSKANTYTGGTTITKGTLLVTNRTGSATGTGAVQVNTGTLGGTGKITGAVTVGTGTSSGAILLPGKSATKPGTLTINSALTFNSLSTYKCVLNRSTPIAGEVTALGVTINSGATFTFVDTGTGTLTVGTVFTVINNTSASPITGTFSNLADSSVFTSNGNNFQASYTGGTGNDLTLTVVP